MNIPQAATKTEPQATIVWILFNGPPKAVR
jgi:hypothetical protein